MRVALHHLVRVVLVRLLELRLRVVRVVLQPAALLGRLLERALQPLLAPLEVGVLLARVVHLGLRILSERRGRHNASRRRARSRESAEVAIATTTLMYPSIHNIDLMSV
jgi:hypothetical protein